MTEGIRVKKIYIKVMLNVILVHIMKELLLTMNEYVFAAVREAETRSS